MDIRKLQRAIVDGLEDVKAQHIAVFNTEHLSAMFERVIIATGTSNRQTKALAASVRDSVKKRGLDVMSTEGEDNGEWIIVDCGAAVVHLMQPAIREYYHLEEIWGGKNVRVKMGDTKQGLVKASEPEPEAPPRVSAARKRAAEADAAAGFGKAPARKAAVKKPVSRQAADDKAANRSAAYKRVAAGKTPGRQVAGNVAGKVAGKTAGRSAVQTIVVKPVAKKAAAKKLAAGRAPARKAPAKKAPARKTAAKRSAG